MFIGPIFYTLINQSWGSKLGGIVGFKLAKFRDVANGTQAGQFAIGERTTVNSISDLDPKYKMLMDQPLHVSWQ